MTDFDPTDPWGQRSPWDVAGQQQPETPTSQETPVTNQLASAPNPFKIGFTLKAASGYDAEWLTPTVYGSTAEETAQRGKDLLLAMKANGLIEFTAQAAEFTRGQFMGGKKPAGAPAPQSQPTFNPNSGQVQYGQAPQPPFGGGAPDGPPRPANVPDGWTYKTGTNKNGKPYKAWFPPRGVEAQPIWVN